MGIETTAMEIVNAYMEQPTPSGYTETYSIGSFKVENPWLIIEEH